MPHRQPRLRTFVAAAIFVLGLFFVDAASGRVLSQADILFQYAPWSASAPARFAGSAPARPGNVLLADIPLVMYPALEITRRNLREGRLPIWNTAMYGGQPFLASYQPALFSPFVVLSVIFAPADALLAHAIVRLLAGGIGMFLFLRRLGLAPPAVWFGALSFLLNPFSIVWLEHPPSAVMLWLPWLLWCVDRVVSSGGRHDLAWLAGLIALSLLGGHPETAFKILLLVGAYASAACLLPRRPQPGDQPPGPRVLFGRLLPAAVLGAALTAVQVVPFVEYMSESGIAAMRRTFTVNPMTVPADYVVTAFVPDFFGNPSRGDVVSLTSSSGATTNHCEQQIYPGNVAWVLTAIAIALAWRRDWRVAFFSVAAVLGALVMYGTPGILELVSSIPLLGVAALSRFGLITIFSVITLGAFGLDALFKDAEPRRILRAVLVAVMAIAAVVAFETVRQWPVFHARALIRELASTIAWSGSLLAGAAAIVLLRVRGTVTVTAASGALVLLAAVDLFSAGFRFHPMIPRAEVFPALPAIDLIRRDRGLYRVAGLEDSLPPTTAAVYGLDDVRGYDGITPRRYGDLLGRAFGSGMLHRIDAGDALGVLDLLNVKYVIGGPAPVDTGDRFTLAADGAARVYRNERAFPRAWLVGRATVRDDAATLDWLVSPGADLRHEAAIAEPLAPQDAPEPIAEGATVTASVVRYEPTLVEVSTDAPVRQLLVLADGYYPGWTATVDGRPAPLVRAYHALRAVPVPAGAHKVRFEYRPRSLLLGAGISAAALLAVGVLALLSRRSNRS